MALPRDSTAYEISLKHFQDLDNINRIQSSFEAYWRNVMQTTINPTITTSMPVFEFGRITEEEKKMSNKWEFHALHTNLIDFDKIAEELSGANPIALITHGETECYVVVSDWLLIKIDALNKADTPNIAGVSPKEGYTVYKIKGQFYEWIKWAKDIKAASWPKTDRKHNTVSVSLPKL